MRETGKEREDVSERRIENKLYIKNKNRENDNHTFECSAQFLFSSIQLLKHIKKYASFFYIYL